MTQKSAEISRQDLYDLVWAKPLPAIAERFGLTANGMAKICDRLNIPRPPRGYWSRQRRDAAEKLLLGPAPEGAGDRVIVGGKRAPARRTRSRLSSEDRNQQLLDAAADIAVQRGLQDVTLKRIARQVGISEAQAHNCFPGRTDLLLALARREIAALERRRREIVARGDDRMASIVVSTISYLHEAAERGPLLQLLLRMPEVKAGLREEREIAGRQAREPILQSLEQRFAVKRSVAAASTISLTALCVRAGGLIGSGRADLATVELLCLPMVMAGARSNESAAAPSESRGRLPNRTQRSKGA